ncbi:MAG: mechanosensitive ion channel family protein [bacterium]|nr:mechanosensitive ion channel family protein [bacterium]
MLNRLAEMEGLHRDILIVGLEIVLIIVVFSGLYWLFRALLTQIKSLPKLQPYKDKSATIQRSGKRLLTLSGLTLSLAAAAYNGYLIYNRVDVLQFTRELITGIPPDFWKQLLMGLGKVVAILIAARYVNKTAFRLLENLKARAKSYEQLKANEESIESFFSSLKKIFSNSIWLLALVLSARVLPIPATIADYLTIILKIYIIISLGLLVVKTVAVVVDSLDALSKKYWYRDDYLGWYDRMAGLIPLLRRCLEYIVYVFVATFVMLQVEFIAHFATYGPRVVQVIGIYFLAKVVVEIVNLLVDKSMGKTDGLSESDRQRQMTLVPIIKSLLEIAVYFSAFVLVLRAFNLNPMPLLAGAGILGVVVGFGAQPLINDVVSGFFILFENLFLVGDYIETGEAEGLVEAIAIRTTRVRNPDGHVHILRNGQIGDIVNFSKEYTYAVVEVGVAYDSNLDQVYQVLTETGEILKQQNPNVQEATEVRGLKRFGESELLVRTLTKVNPGRHRGVARALRKMIKEAFDREGIEIPFARRVIIFQNGDGGDDKLKKSFESAETASQLDSKGEKN